MSMHSGRYHKMKLHMFTPAKWTPKRLLAICLVVIILGSTAGAAVSYWSATSGSSFTSTSGVKVELVDNEVFATGLVFPNSQTVYLHNTSFHGDNVNIEMANGNWNGTVSNWVNTTSIAMGTGNLTIDPDNPYFGSPVTVSGAGIQMLNFTNIIPNDNYKEDLVYTTNATASITVGNVTGLTSYGLVNPTSLIGYDAAISNATGFVTFDQVPPGTNVHAAVEPLGILYLRNQTPPHGLVTDATLVVFYEDLDTDTPIIINKTTSGGYVDLTELNLTKSFIISANSPSHFNMTTLIDDISVQNTAFMLQKSKPQTPVTFVLDDKTGDFGPDDNVALEIFRGINSTSYDAINGTSTRWLAISGDRIGNANLFNSSSLETEVRYRLKVKNNRNQERSLGTFVPKQPATVTLSIENVDFSVNKGQTFNWNASLTDNPHQRISYEDPTLSTTNFHWNVSYFNNDSLIYSSPSNCLTACGTFSEAYSLNSSAANSTLIVRWSALKDGQYIGATTVGTRPGAVIPKTFPVSSNWASLGAIAILLILTAGGGGITSPGMTGLLISGTAGLLWLLKLLTFGPLTQVQSAGIIFLGLFISVTYMIGTGEVS